MLQGEQVRDAGGLAFEHGDQQRLELPIIVRVDVRPCLDQQGQAVQPAVGCCVVHRVVLRRVRVVERGAPGEEQAGDPAVAVLDGPDQRSPLALVLLRVLGPGGEQQLGAGVVAEGRCEHQGRFPVSPRQVDSRSVLQQQLQGLHVPSFCSAVNGALGSSGLEVDRHVLAQQKLHVLHSVQRGSQHQRSDFLPVSLGEVHIERLEVLQRRRRDAGCGVVDQFAVLHVWVVEVVSVGDQADEVAGVRVDARSVQRGHAVVLDWLFGD